MLPENIKERGRIGIACYVLLNHSPQLSSRRLFFLAERYSLRSPQPGNKEGYKRVSDIRYFWDCCGKTRILRKKIKIRSILKQINRLTHHQGKNQPNPWYRVSLWQFDTSRLVKNSSFLRNTKIYFHDKNRPKRHRAATMQKIGRTNIL